MLKRLSRSKYLGWRALLAVGDICLLALALVIALWLRFDDKPLGLTLSRYVLGHIPGLVIFAIFYIIVLSAFRMYRYAWRFAGMEAAWSLIFAGMLGLAATAIMFSFIYKNAFPRSVIIMWWLMSIAFIGGLRVFLRIGLRNYYSSRNELDIAQPEDAAPTRALMVGAAEYASGILKSIANTHSLRHYDIIGVLDDRADKTGLFYGGVRVLGTTALLHKYLSKQEVDEVIFAMSEDMDGSSIKQQVLECRKHNVRVKMIPNFVDLLNKPTPVRLEDIKVEDLLRRPMRSLDVQRFGGYVAGKRVLITGAGGSIGSEICRQVMKLNPSEVILLGHGENSIFSIDQELRREHPEMANNIFPIIASVKNRTRIDRVFSRFAPQVVFHAAAHKHLPLMEYNVCEAVHNNVIGTYNLVQACIAHNIERMVMISTDKAADPTSVMGATKWLCEAVVKSAAHSQSKTSFVCTRFGNVLGSRGSVIPVFTEQIKNGGPVTVTHPDMTRYFMTIPEAVRLVLQAGSVGQNGDVYLLDMGKPVKILDLAKDMIRLNGYEPNADIPIIFTGIRPGEKMHEQLASTTEKVQPSEYEGLNFVRNELDLSYKEVKDLIARFQKQVEELDGGGVLAVFEKIIPGYASAARAVFARLLS